MLKFIKKHISFIIPNLLTFTLATIGFATQLYPEKCRWLITKIYNMHTLYILMILSGTWSIIAYVHLKYKDVNTKIDKINTSFSDANTLLQIQSNANKEEFENFRKNVFGETTLKYTSITTRILKDVLLIDLLNQNPSIEYLDKICNLLYQAQINIIQLQEYGIKNKDLIDRYRILYNEKQNHEILMSNPSLKERLTSKNSQDEPNRDKQ